MVDLTGKFYLLDELDENFVKRMDVEKYKEYQGAWVKNAYDPQFMMDGKYDEKSCAGCRIVGYCHCHDDESKQSGIQNRKSMSTTIRTAGVQISRYFIIRWIAGLSVLQLARSE